MPCHGLISHRGGQLIVFCQRFAIFRPDLGQTPVQQNGLTEGAYQDILRLHIPVNNTTGMRILQGIANLDDDIDQLSQVITIPVIQNFAQRIAMHILHREVIVAAVIST